MESLTERVEELKQDKKRLVEEYEAKLNKVITTVDSKQPASSHSGRYEYIKRRLKMSITTGIGLHRIQLV